MLVFGRRVGYEQSIKSFFADDDPDMTAYQAAARSFGDDNFVFIAYDDPELLTPEGMDRVRELADGRRAGRGSTASCGSSRSTRCPCCGRSTTRCWQARQAPAADAATLALNAAEAGREEPRPEEEPDDGRRRSPHGLECPHASSWRCCKERVMHHPLFLGTVVDATGTTTAVVVRLKKTAEHDVQKTVAAIRPRRPIGSRSSSVGTPGGGRAAGAAGRRLHQHRADGRRLAVVGMLLIGLVTLSAVQSLWWAIVPIRRGLGGLARDGDDPVDLPPEARRSRAVRSWRRSSC